MKHKFNQSRILFFMVLFLINAALLSISQPLISANNLIYEPADNFVRDSSQDLRYGEIIKSVKCIKNPEQSYAIYIPSNYIPEKRWPIIYIFDPGARGNIPIELMKEAAECYGYIIVSSNNSRNGPWKIQAEAAQAMLEDTRSRMSIDDSSIYLGGFSGGARVAAIIAQGCRCAKGILLCGAGFSNESPPSSKDQFFVFSTVGSSDMNYSELVQLDKTLETLQIPHFMRRFNGSHQWAPKDVWIEAFAWMRLIAMKNGQQSRDEQFIAAELTRIIERARALEDSGDAYFAWQNLHEASKLLQGLADTKKIDEHNDVLEKNDAVIEGQEREEKEIAEQSRLQSKIILMIEQILSPKSRRLNDFRDNGEIDIRINARNAIRQLRRNCENEDRPEKRRVLERTRSNISAYLIDEGKFLMDSHRFKNAKELFELAIEIQPNAPLPYISLARCLMRMDDKEQSIEELNKALETGLNVQALIDILKQVPELNPLVNDPEFQKIIKDESSMQ